MFTTPRARDPVGSFELRTSPAQSEQAEDARRYLRRRRELLLCVLVATLGVLVARSIPLVEHEQALCECRKKLRDAHRPVLPEHVLHDVTSLRASPDRATLDDATAVDVLINREGVWAENEQGRVQLAESCGTSHLGWSP